MRLNKSITFSLNCLIQPLDPLVAKLFVVFAWLDVVLPTTQRSAPKGQKILSFAYIAWFSSRGPKLGNKCLCESPVPSKT